MKYINQHSEQRQRPRKHGRCSRISTAADSGPPGTANRTTGQARQNQTELQLTSHDNYGVKSFIDKVTNTERLCGGNNFGLREHCLRNVINAQIIGRAKSVILKIPEELRTWKNVVSILKKYSIWNIC